MKKVLILCNTYYQLITAVQICLSFEGSYSLVLSDTMKNSDKICERIKKTGLFETVCTVNVKEKKSTSSYIKDCVFGNAPSEIKDTVFDELLGFNMDLSAHGIFAKLYEKNKSISVNKMEEGLLSYNTPETTCRAMDVAYKIRKLSGKANLKDIEKSFYCFSPAAYKGKLKPVPIPRIKADDEKIKNILNRIFLEKDIAPYGGKYIFLSCIYDIEGGKPIGELDFALKLAEKVGKDNLTVKVHPRDDIEKYRRAGLKIDENSGVPWEVIQINQDFSQKVLITTLSSGIINFNPVLEKVSKSYYGYGFCDLSENSLANHYREVIDGYLADSQLGLRDVFVLKDFKELENE